jgi:hypothetical protein
MRYPSTREGVELFARSVFVLSSIRWRRDISLEVGTSGLISSTSRRLSFAASVLSETSAGSWLTMGSRPWRLFASASNSAAVCAVSPRISLAPSRACSRRRNGTRFARKNPRSASKIAWSASRVAALTLARIPEAHRLDADLVGVLAAPRIDSSDDLGLLIGVQDPVGDGPQRRLRLFEGSE